MPVLINAQNQLAEDLPQEQADLALQQGTHELPLNNPEGKPVTANLAIAQQLISQGYTQPHPEQLGNLLNYAKYSSTPEQIKTGLEGAASGATFGLSTGAERLAGASPEEIQARREINPGVHMLGEAAGLGASMLAGVGEGALLGKAGQAVASRIVGEGLLAKVGSAAARNAVETALVSSGDEVSKMLSSDPEQSAQTALVNIGLNGLLGAGIGGAFGTAAPLWKAANETKVGQFLNVIRNKANGLGKDTLPSPAIQNALDTAGVDIPNEMKAALSENPEARGMFQALQESTTRAGKESQAAYQTFKERANDAALSSLGKTKEDLDSIATMSDHDTGSHLKEALSNQIKESVDPLTEKFENVKSKFSKTELGTPEISNLGNEISKMAQDQGYGILEGTPQGGLINKVLGSLPNVKTLEDLRKLQSQVGEQTQNPEMWGLGKSFKNIFRNTEEGIVESKLAAESPELLAEHQLARSGYRSTMDTIDQLNDRLHVGKYAGPGSFLKNLKEMNPEDILRRLTVKNDANLLELLKEKFPAAASSVKDSFLNQALKQASAKAAQGESINIKSLFNVMDKWSPEIKDFVLSPEASQQISAIRSLIEQLPNKMNNSGTAKTLDALWAHVPGGVGSMVSLMTGHNPVLGYVLGQLSKYIGREIPDAMKLATLKFLGSDLPINSSGFRAMAEFVSHSIEGQRMIKQGIQSIFKSGVKSGVQVLPQSFNVSDKERNKLKKKLDEVQQKPEDLMNTGGDSNYYLPDHGVAFGAIAARAVQYLNALKPNTTKMGLLDAEPVPSSFAEAKYNRALDIAEQPLTILKHIQNATLIPEDVQTLQNIYPALYQGLTQKITSEIIDRTSQGKLIPYKNRIALSMFLSQPLDSTMTPQAIQSMQPQMPEQPPQAPQKQKSHHSMTALNKLSGMSSTPQQARESARLSQKA